MGKEQLREVNAKLEAIITFLKEHDGETYEMYNHVCPSDNNEPDSNIIEYAEDVKEIINKMAITFIKIDKEDLPF